MLALVLLGLAVMSVAGAFVLRGYLMGRADDQLRTTSVKIVRQLVEGRQLDEPRTGVRLHAPSEMYVRVTDAYGAVRPGEQSYWGDGGPHLPGGLAARLGETFTVPGQGGSRSDWRVHAVRLPDGGLLVTALPLDEIDSTVGRLALIDAFVGVAVLAVLAGLGVWVVRASLRPLAAMEETAGAIAAGDLSRRVPAADGRTEVGRLAGSINGMLAQIEAAFGARAVSEAAARRSEERMRRFVADASHELRTPLTAIRGFAEFYRQGAARTPAELDRLIGRIESTAARMGLLVEDLLLLARLDRQRPIERRPVDLLAVAAESVQEARVTAPGRDLALTVHGSVAFQVLGDEPRLRQVVGNLLSNAVAHTPDGTPIGVALRPGGLRGAPAAVIEIADAGPGLTPEQRERVFERFYRADRARSREDGGTGLGLAIVAALVAAHRGLVEVESEPGEGAVFRVLLALDEGA
ncbi:HAMP domain-containing histidine kinase [Actinomadura sp. PM05-2]|uniref:histidine kinase n=2 Tax=Actinomadura parmotrematis TaxID=2864039 RepID=A0ABS7FY38_9ACTN|nr:HAMP domain-containing histidine kinase [Actinomadura parmotrematis]